MSTSGSYDVAEDFPTRDESLKPGDLVSIDSGEIGFVKKTSKANDPSILGIYSEKPGLRLSQADGNLSGGKAIPVALAGRVVVNVTDENGPIMPGDYLTSSNRTGYAMKATKAGPTLGKALEPSSDESGKVLAFVNVSYYIPTTELQGGDAILVDYLLISGLAKIENLEVVGDATFKGNIIVAGHFVTAGESPQTVVLAANTSANDPQIDIEGNDTSGSIKVVTTQSVQPGDLAKVIFAQPFDKRPKVFIYPSNLEATTVQLYREVQVNYFIIKLISPLASDRTYEFNYLIVE
ncbi:hypothetical protein HYS85_00190 [Candidatus Saccharibacteria bacterium]|nr:hypothetical protein [Candidatus Saccharibacteria bacterium]